MSVFYTRGRSGQVLDTSLGRRLTFEHSTTPNELAARFLDREYKEMEAYLSLIQTTFIIFLLSFGSISFSQDTQKLVIAPIEKMVPPCALSQLFLLERASKSMLGGLWGVPVRFCKQ